MRHIPIKQLNKILCKILNMQIKIITIFVDKKVLTFVGTTWKSKTHLYRANAHAKCAPTMYLLVNETLELR